MDKKDKKELIELVVNKNNIVTKSNRLIEAEYSMAAMEFKVVQTVFSNIQPTSSRHSVFKFPIRQFMDMLELKGESGYSQLKQITLNLFKPIEITVDGETKQVSWFQLVNYNEGTGTITIEVNSFWQEYLYSLEGNFTSYKLFNITHLSSSYSPRLYELLKMRVGLNGEKEYSIKELKAKLGIEEGKYPKFGNFKQRVLLPAQRELKEQSDIFFEFEEIKHGRATTHLRFFIYRNNRNKVIEAPIGPNVSLKSQLLKYGIKEERVDELISQYAEARIQANIDYTMKQNENSEVKNIAGFLKSAIEQDYAGQAKRKPAERMGNYDKFDAEMAKKNANENDEASEHERLAELAKKKPTEMEEIWLEIMALSRKVKRDEEAIRGDITRNLTEYQAAQEKIKGGVILPSKFKNPLIKEICKEVIFKMS